MADIIIHAGDFSAKRAPFTQGRFFFPAGGFKVDKVPAADITKLEPMTDEAVKRLGSTVAWAAAGGFLLGPVGLLAGALAGGNARRVTFSATFRDGRRLLASADGKTFQAIQAGAFDAAA